MPTAEEIRKDAELVVDVCMSVEEDDVVTIICDNEHRTEADALASVALERKAWPVIMDNEAQVRRGRADTHFPMAPPRNLHEAMTSSDEIIIVTNLERANRFAHVPALKQSCESNAKICSVEPGMGEWGLTVEKIHAATQRAKDAMAALEGKTECHVTSPAGTDVRVSIEGRPALEVTSIKKRGQMMGPLPLWAEVAFAAVEDRTQGTIDGVDNADIAGEFAFGVSEVAPFGTPSEKGRVGTVHFALGDNHLAYPGGQNVSKLHLDGVILNASLQIVDDGTYIVKDGEWAL